MRTESVKVPPLLLAAALLGIGLPLAAQDAATRPEQVRREIVEERVDAARDAAEAREEAARARAEAEAEREGVSVLTGDRVVAPGEVIEGDMVVVNGDLRVRGEIRGNAVVTGGDLVLEPGGTVLGDAVVTGGKLLTNGGRVMGEMRTISAPGAWHGHTPRPPRPPVAMHGPFAWLDPIGEGLAGVFTTLAMGLVLAAVGAGVVFYALPKLRLVSDTVRSSTGRSAAVGLAATFLILPAFILLVVALAVSIIGIPLLLVAVPLYPLAVLGAYAFGLVAAAHAIGEHTAEQRDHGFDFRYRNAYAYVFLGIGLLIAPLVAAHLIGMVGFLGWLSALLAAAGAVVMWAVATVGMGAVILTRGGTRKAATPRAYDPIIDGDPLFEEEPLAGEPRV